LRLWEQDPEFFLATPALLPLASLARTDSPKDLLAQVASQVARIESDRQRQEIAACAELLAWLRFKEDFVYQFFREEAMRESTVYQDILAKGMQQGMQQGRQAEALSMVIRLLKKRFGELDRDLQAKIYSLSVAQLESLAEVLLEFVTVADLEAWLKCYCPS
jgi:predicted transposase YdaD